MECIFPTVTCVLYYKIELVQLCRGFRFNSQNKLAHDHPINIYIRGVLIQNN